LFVSKGHEMTSEVWINLPVQDIERSKGFYLGIGFSLSVHGNGPYAAGFKIGPKNLVMMLFENEFFRQMLGEDTPEGRGAEMLISLRAESRDDIDKLAVLVPEAGGDIVTPPAEQLGWMYCLGFKDPDGHRWNALYMDLEKMK
jgi:predicted lactoylglutathione lyase